MFNGDGDEEEEVAFVDEDEGLTRKVEMADGFVRAFLTCWYRSVPYAASKNASEFDIFIQFYQAETVDTSDLDFEVHTCIQHIHNYTVLIIMFYHLHCDLH